MPRDAPSQDILAASWEKDIEYFCAHCGAPVTKGRWEMAINGGFEHVFFNPAGIVFRVLCFKEAPGAIALGAASGQFTWFRGYLCLPRLRPAPGLALRRDGRAPHLLRADQGQPYDPSTRAVSAGLRMRHWPSGKSPSARAPMAARCRRSTWLPTEANIRLT